MSLEYPPSQDSQTQAIFDPIEDKQTELHILPKHADSLNPKNLVKTKQCRFWKTCRKEDCKFAHSLSQLRLPLCFFGENCRKKTKCSFLHPNEKVEDRYKILGKKMPQF
jgi:hypothetical protein